MSKNILFLFLKLIIITIILVIYLIVKIMKLKEGFSLIEVIIATSILTISVFGVYKLIGENTKIINNSSNNIQLNYIIPIIKECIENIGFATYNKTVGQEYYFSIGNDYKQCNNVNIYSNINNIDYSFKGKIIESGINYIKWELYVNDFQSKILTGSYLQIKK